MSVSKSKTNDVETFTDRLVLCLVAGELTPEDAQACLSALARERGLVK